MQAKLIELRRDTNDVLGSIKSRRAGYNWPVNWADLHCVDAQHWQDADGDKGYTVIISEASPEATELARMVAEALGTKWGRVNVITEW